MSAPLSDLAALARVVQLDQEAFTAARRCEEREAEIADLRDRQMRLQQRLISEQDDRPDDSAGDDLAEALIADPEVELSATARSSLRTARDRTARTIGDHDAASNVVVQALAKIEARINAAESALVGERGAAADAWRTFVEASYQALLEEARERFERLRDALIQPLLALADARELNGGAKIIGGSWPKFSDDSRLVLRRFGVPITTTVWLDPKARPGQDGWIDYAAALPAWRARLAASELIDDLGRSERVVGG